MLKQEFLDKGRIDLLLLPLFFSEAACINVAEVDIKLFLAISINAKSSAITKTENYLETLNVCIGT
ncbi:MULTISPECIES: hypothetical protein [unclassified Snodgrassella]|uniref:hypothetical protein n=1 Tax=unclassified Snodgrassella TaxID=2625236 RepID=UPI0018DCFDAF|nr:MULTISPECIES: hypothetical protein [Snodgrassella]MBI0068692.1 hypothetical protein [Snodgrassella sp. M0110]MBI0077375.1 hypothetical protein [Snodgrassella sp. M0118]MBI0079822.1 hypothetical protein [Snodgrassella sp. M0112]